MKISKLYLKILVLGFSIMLAGCQFGKGTKVTYVDPEKGIDVTVTEDGLIVNGTLPLSETASIKVTQETDTEE